MTFFYGQMILLTFFLQIQGSGIGVFENGDKLRFYMMGTIILNTHQLAKFDRKLLPKGNVNFHQEFLRKNPDKIRNILNKNQRYIL